MSDSGMNAEVASMSLVFFFFSSRRRHTRFDCDWSSDVCSSDLQEGAIFCERIEAGVAEQEVQFASIEAGAKLLSAKNRALLRIIAEWHPKSVSDRKSVV